jgi:hypothetical protein
MKNKKKFIDKVQPYANKIGAELGVPAEALMAQWALESSWGTKESGANNLFGIKGNSKNGTLVETKENFKSDKERDRWLKAKPGRVIVKDYGNGKYAVKDWFKSYDTPAAAFEDKAQLLAKKYVTNTEAKTPDEYFNSLGQYATDPDYVGKLRGTLNSITQTAAELENERLGFFTIPDKKDVAAVKDLQAKLGFAPEQIDGSLGPATITKLQEHNQMVKDTLDAVSLPNENFSSIEDLLSSKALANPLLQ